MEEKYIVTVNLKNGTKIEGQQDYNWGFESRLNDLNKQFVDICGNMFNKDEIVSVIVQDNPLCKEPEKEEENE